MFGCLGVRLSRFLRASSVERLPSAVQWDVEMVKSARKNKDKMDAAAEAEIRRTWQRRKQMMRAEDERKRKQMAEEERGKKQTTKAEDDRKRKQMTRAELPVKAEPRGGCGGVFANFLWSKVAPEELVASWRDLRRNLAPRKCR